LIDPIEEPDDSNWNSNYFNYFTEVEECFQQARGTGLFLLSPLDWALIENWKNAGIPLDAVKRGIDDAFEKWRARKTKRRLINSLAYCAQAVAESAGRVPASRQETTQTAPFSADEIRAHLEHARDAIRNSNIQAVEEIAAALEAIAADAESCVTQLEDLERRLTTLEEKMVALARGLQSDEDLLEMRRNLDRELKPYRGKMTADQLSMLERRYLDTALLEHVRLPRLSLFYIR
jgi:hypothetical protein